jgi:uncharacterized membrane protein YqjE
MVESENWSAGAWGAGRRFGHALLSLAETRIRLFALEARAEKVRLLGTVLQLCVALGFAMVALFLGALTIAILAWEMGRYAGLLLMTGVFLAASAFLFWRIRESLKHQPAPFARTIREFEKDRQCLTPPS